MAGSPATTMAAQRIEIASQGDVSAVAFAGESQVVGGSSNGVIRRWKIEGGQQQGSTMQAGGRVYSIAVSKDGRWIVSGDQGRKAIIWNAATHETVFQFAEHPDYVLGVDVSRDSTKVAWVDYYAAHTSSISSGTQLLSPLPHSRSVDVKFCPDGTQFATASYGYGVRVYCANTGAILFDSGSKGSTGCWPAAPLAWSSDGRQLFVGVQGKIICFNVSGSSSSEWPIHETQSQPCMASTGRFIACSAGSSVSLWDCLSHKQIGNIITHSSAVTSIALSPSGAYLACGNGSNITIHNLRNICPPEYFDSGLPLIRVSEKVFQSWSRGDLRKTEMLLLEEITSASSPAQYLLANRALVRVHSKNLALAVEDAKESLQVRPSPIGYIAMAMALLVRGDRERALCTFDLAFHDCEPHNIRFLLLLKLIFMFESGIQEEAILCLEHLVTRANERSNDDDAYLYTQALGVVYMKKGSYPRAIPLIGRARNLAPKGKEYPLLEAVSLIFGWSLKGLDGVREKLCLASTGITAVKEDVAYPLIGTFKCDICPHYGEGADALGHLLEEIVSRFGEVTVLAWSGRSSSYNSCLPASLSAYNQMPYDPPSLEGEGMEACVAELRGKLPRLDALSICNQVSLLPPALFVTRRLHLPCVVFSVRRLRILETHNGNKRVYRARVSGVGNVEFTTADDLPLKEPKKLVLVHPWIRYIQGPNNGVASSDYKPDSKSGSDSGSDSKSESDSGSDSDSNTGSDEDVPPLPLDAVPAPQVVGYARALQMMARLGQPFSALLLAQQRDGVYKRVAAEHEIVVSGLGTDINSKNIQVKVLEIL